MKKINLVMYEEGVEVIGLTSEELKPYLNEIYNSRYEGESIFTIKASKETLYGLLFKLNDKYEVSLH